MLSTVQFLPSGRKSIRKGTEKLELDVYAGMVSTSDLNLTTAHVNICPRPEFCKSAFQLVGSIQRATSLLQQAVARLVIVFFCHRSVPAVFLKSTHSTTSTALCAPVKTKCMYLVDEDSLASSCRSRFPELLRKSYCKATISP